MYDAENLKKMADFEMMLKLIPSDYWSECREIREALSVYLINHDLRELQLFAIIFAFGVTYGEDNMICRIRHLEKRVHDLTDLNQRLTESMQETVKQNQSIQDVKQEGAENE